MVDLGPTQTWLAALWDRSDTARSCETVQKAKRLTENCFAGLSLSFSIFLERASTSTPPPPPASDRAAVHDHRLTWISIDSAARVESPTGIRSRECCVVSTLFVPRAWKEDVGQHGRGKGVANADRAMQGGHVTGHAMSARAIHCVEPGMALPIAKTSVGVVMVKVERWRW